MIDGEYIDENMWKSECGRFIAKRLLPSGRRWIVLDTGRRWSGSYPDLDHARIAMAETIELEPDRGSILGDT